MKSPVYSTLIGLVSIAFLGCMSIDDVRDPLPFDPDSTRLTAALDLKAPPPIALAPVPFYGPPVFRTLGNGLVVTDVARDPNIPRVDLFLRLDGTIEVEGSRYADANVLRAKMIEIKDRIPTPDFDLEFEGGTGPGTIERRIPVMRLLTDSCLSRDPPARSICLPGPVR